MTRGAIIASFCVVSSISVGIPLGNWAIGLPAAAQESSQQSPGEVGSAQDAGNRSRRELPNIDTLLETERKTAQITDQLERITVIIADKKVPMKRFTGFGITVINNSDRIIEVNGEGATVNIGSAEKQCASMSEIETSIDAPDNPKSQPIRTLTSTLEGAISIGAIQAVQDHLNERGSVRDRYGWDEKRRDRLFDRFGKRVLNPGDTTSGVIYFRGAIKEGQASFSIPVSDFYDDKDRAALVVRKAF
ncbi:MAG TPA: hypothetical protein V6D17_14730 [Candidatus Obscuribacterales bacterium]